MFIRPKHAIALAIALSLSLPLHAGNFGNRPTIPNRPAASYVAPTEAEAEDMLYMREEEKLARDVYLTLDDAWGISPFANISTSEQKHMNAMLLLLRKYRLPDPAAGNAVGEFTDRELQALYDKLIAKGVRTPKDALEVGGLIEEVDMVDIQDAIAHADKPDIDAVYEDLMCGSRNHLRAFARTYEALTGLPYKAQVLAQDVVNVILAGSVERCGRL